MRWRWRAWQGVRGQQHPTPAVWSGATPVPVTLTKGNKGMAVGTPKVTSHCPSRPMPVGFAAASALEQICQNNGRPEMTDQRRRPEMTDRSQHVRR